MISEQARVFGRYLLKREPSSRVQELFAKAMATNSGAGDKQDQALLAFAVKHPHFLPLVDAGLALIKPNSEVRRRLYIMFSILEASPDYHQLFLPKKHPVWFLLVIVGTGIRAIARAVCGIIVIKVVAR